MTDHTPGPWYVYRGEDGEAIAVQKFVEGDNGGTTGKGIARMPVPQDWGAKNARSTLQEIDANARLIAAAPDLLAEHTAACDAADAILALMTMEYGRLMVEGPDEEIELTLCGHSVRIPAHKFNKLYNATTRAAIIKATSP